jgi:hypothetical protein
VRVARRQGEGLGLVARDGLTAARTGSPPRPCPCDYRKRSSALEQNARVGNARISVARRGSLRAGLVARPTTSGSGRRRRWLLAAQRSAAHLHLASLASANTSNACSDYKPRTTLEKRRVAEALQGLPALERALSSGSAVRELTRVALQETEHEWLEFAHGKMLPQLEQVLAGKRLGDSPGPPGPFELVSLPDTLQGAT